MVGSPNDTVPSSESQPAPVKCVTCGHPEHSPGYAGDCDAPYHRPPISEQRGQCSRCGAHPFKAQPEPTPSPQGSTPSQGEQSVPPIPSESSLQRAAQAWCSHATESITMDMRLAIAFARILDEEIAAVRGETQLACMAGCRECEIEGCAK